MTRVRPPVSPETRIKLSKAMKGNQNARKTPKQSESKKG